MKFNSKCILTNLYLKEKKYKYTLLRYFLK